MQNMHLLYIYTCKKEKEEKRRGEKKYIYCFVYKSIGAKTCIFCIYA